MPPRYAYWTILIDNQPTAFRATKVEELLPTFNRLKQKNPSAVMMWSQFGKLWKSPEEAMAVGKTKDPRQPSSHQAFKPSIPQAFKPSSPRAFRPSGLQVSKPSDRPKLEWKPKGTFTPAERGHSKPSADRPRPKLEWKPKGSFTPAPRTHPKTEWTPRAEGGAKPAWKPRPQTSGFKTSRPQDSRPKTQDNRDRPKLEWTPKPEAESPKPQALRPKPSRPRRVPPKPGSKNWRPGGDHQDPRQKYLDAKKAKWTRFKKAIRDRHDKKGKP